MIGRRVLLLAACASLGACLGEPYQRPELEVPAGFRIAVEETPQADDRQWWQGFGDPVLDGLVEEALRNNEDLRVAAARVDEFHGAMMQVRAGLVPGVGYSVQSGQQQPSRAVPPGSDAVVNSVYGGLTAGWEIDVWGRVRNLTAASAADWRASEADRRAAVLSVVGATVTGYVVLLSLDEQLATARSTLESRAKALAVFQKRHKGGVVSGVEVAQAQSAYEVAAASVPVLEQQIALQENALSVLLGRNPGPIQRGRTLEQLGTPAVPAGLPSDVLTWRPDVVAAEQQLVAANARVSAARALYFPSISLTGFLGSASTSLGELFSAGTDTWNYVGSAAGPIFEGGANVGANQVADARKAQLVANYRNVVRRAFADVDDALVSTVKTTERTKAQKAQVDALIRYATLSRKRYDGGYTSFLEVLDAETSLFNAELLSSQGERDRLLAHVDLYKALGGGWVDVAAARAPQPDDPP
jgi:multidrug efflux system outer membrane protein